MDCKVLWITKRKALSKCILLLLLLLVVQKVDNAIHHITLYPLDSAIGFPNTYSLDSDLSSGQCYPSFEQQGPDVCTNYSQARSSVPPKIIKELLFAI